MVPGVRIRGDTYAILTLFLAVASTAPSQTNTSVLYNSAKLYTLPSPAHPRPGTAGTAFALDITSGPDGALWFTEHDSGAIGRITTSGAVTEFLLPQGNRVPMDIVTGPDGALWFTENEVNANNQVPNTPRIGRMTTAGELAEHVLPSGEYVEGITVGPDGALWFVETTHIGRITVSGNLQRFDLPSGFITAFLAGITAGPDGALWFTPGLFVDMNKIGRISTAGLITVYNLTSPECQPVPNVFAGCLPTAITVGPDGLIWFVEGNASRIGRTTTSGVISEFIEDTPGNGAADIAVGPDGAMWTVSLNGYRMNRITTEATITGSAIPFGGWNVAVGPDKNLWIASDRLIQKIVPTSLALSITAKAGPPAARVWAIRMTNLGVGAALNAQLSDFSLTQVGGTACTPVITSRFPINVGTIAPGAMATSNVMLNFTGCASAARFRLTVFYAVNGAFTTGTAILNNQFQ